ncbi:MAG: LysM peptidoglycan-binding domain-containing protein [Phycisphaerales bacterium]|nr:MAG: LysM peptidoglycan-binding domain-containing protein [Phycisphaerales bacterium]
MTSDAKIGLLLGLVFIFIIAFIVNGLPSLRTETSGGELQNSVLLSSQNDRAAIGVNERKAEAILEEPGAPGQESVKPAEPGAADDQKIRFKSPMPQPGFVVREREEETLENIILRDSPLSDSLIFQERVSLGPALKQDDTATEQKGAGDSRSIEVLRTDRSRENELVRRSDAIKETKAPAPKKYVIAEGDTLAGIAKKFYGPEEGNRIANINRIFEANKQVLKSADMIIAGQELLIPALAAKAESKKNEGSAGVGGALFEPVKSVGRRSTAGDGLAGGAGRYYTVQEGDSLWTIAAAQLGSGARYQDIYKLNMDVMKDEDSVAAGVRLKLPARD